MITPVGKGQKMLRLNTKFIKHVQWYFEEEYSNVILQSIFEIFFGAQLCEINKLLTIQ